MIIKRVFSLDNARARFASSSKLDEVDKSKMMTCGSMPSDKKVRNAVISPFCTQARGQLSFNAICPNNSYNDSSETTANHRGLLPTASIEDKLPEFSDIVI